MHSGADILKLQCHAALQPLVFCFLQTCAKLRLRPLLHIHTAYCNMHPEMSASRIQRRLGQPDGGDPARSLVDNPSMPHKMYEQQGPTTSLHDTMSMLPDDSRGICESFFPKV